MNANETFVEELVYTSNANASNHSYCDSNCDCSDPGTGSDSCTCEDN